jgi:serine/threonine protein kinase
MGIVLKAFDPVLNRVVAVKVLQPSLAAQPVARKRFLREARAAAAVSNDHVVRIYAVDEDQGLPFLVMEFISGITLQKKIEQEAPLDLRETLRIGMQIASGLEAAHHQGVVHRDIKPANILLENSVEKVKITDFGLARSREVPLLTANVGSIFGTPEYMAPEQTVNSDVDFRADLFSLGSVLYAMCTGRSPFRAGSVMATLRKVADEAAPPITKFNPQTPSWLVQLIEELHAKRPEDRPKSAAEVERRLACGLAQLQNGGGGLAQLDLRGRESWMLRRRHKVTLMMSLLLAVASLVLAVAALFSNMSWRTFEKDSNPGQEIIEGVGYGAFRLGASRGELIRAFGNPESGSQGNYVLWHASHHVDCLLDENERAIELRFNPGFEIPLTTGVRIGSEESEIEKAYGKPDAVLSLYGGRAKKLEYGKRGVLFWVNDKRVTQIVIFHPYDNEGH